MDIQDTFLYSNSIYISQVKEKWYFREDNLLLKARSRDKKQRKNSYLLEGELRRYPVEPPQYQFLHTEDTTQKKILTTESNGPSNVFFFSYFVIARIAMVLAPLAALVTETC
jgi:hypothetical protein